MADPLTFWSVFFQLAAGIVLLFRRGEPRAPVRILAAMLLLNAGVTAILFHVYWPPIADGIRVAAALDAPTEVLMFAFLAAMSRASWARKAMWGLIGAAVAIGAVAPFAYQHPATPLTSGFVAFRGAVFFVGLGLVCFRLARGAETWERWAALAFLPRAMYFTTTGGFRIGDVLEGGAWLHDQVLLLTLPFLGGVSMLALARLLRRPAPPGRFAAVVVPLTGVAIALSELGIRQVLEVDPIIVPVLSFITLGVHRPFFLLVALAPALLPFTVKRATIAAAAGGVAMLGLSGLYPEVPEAGVLFGFMVGAMALAVMEVLRPRLEQLPKAEPAAAPTLVARGASAEMPPAGDAPPAAPDRPQWQTLLLALRGSCLPPGEAARGDERLRQKALVETTGIPAPRVSTIVRELNESAETKLDTYAPGWREAGPVPLQPQLIQQFRGQVPGMSGVWVYYRLTPHGEFLAGALAALAVAPSLEREPTSERSKPAL